MVMGLVTTSLAADPIVPQPFAPDVEARPIAQVDSHAPLRWQAKRPAPVSISDLPATPIQETQLAPQTESISRSHTPTMENATRSEMTTVRGGWNITRIDPSVRPAQHISSDPFQDPFGDRQTAQREPALLLLPTHAESNVETLPPPLQRRPGHPPGGSAPQTESISRGEMAALASQPGYLPPPASIMPPRRSAAPCDRVFNDRNCCDLEIGCTDFRNRLLADSIRNISLDITPRYSPDLTPDEDIELRIDKLRLLEQRTWRDRRGQVVATGKMANIENNAVVLVDEDGKEVARVAIQELGEDELCYVTAWWRLPAECTLGGIRTVQREWIPSTFVWTASALCHKPLYFEEVQLERYGHTAGPFRQPFISGAHFFLNIAALPYQMAIHPPHECQYALGYYRPGSCAPWMIPPIPLSLRGAAAETGAILGGVYLIP